MEQGRAYSQNFKMTKLACSPYTTLALGSLSQDAKATSFSYL